ncbi:uncharacterized protein LOC135197605 [Macrobrachium nipponense]|uniref:uncharacterized protein LOC135197605 n=1 Tax=Macrobrachium nipponense TaxID=159736 RepID=UPI0030C8D109
MQGVMMTSPLLTGIALYTKYGLAVELTIGGGKEERLNIHCQRLGRRGSHPLPKRKEDDDMSMREKEEDCILQIDPEDMTKKERGTRVILRVREEARGSPETYKTLDAGNPAQL